MTKLRIGTRGSKLALWQARWAAEQLRTHHGGVSIELVSIQTTGDRQLETSLLMKGDKGFFTDELERALSERRIDLAVHSLKDLPTTLPQGLEIGAYLKREDPRDVFISVDALSLNDLPPFSQVGTSSVRRMAQVRSIRPDLSCVSIRGNIDTRLRKLEKSGNLSGIILAAAGIIRMGWTGRITQYLDEDSFLPAPGQGVIALEIASERDDVRGLLTGINHRPSEYEARAERAFQHALEGGCQVPLGARAIFDEGFLVLKGVVLDPEGSQAVRVREEGTDPDLLGRETARIALARGAAKLLSEIA